MLEIEPSQFWITVRSGHSRKSSEHSKELLAKNGNNYVRPASKASVMSWGEGVLLSACLLCPEVEENSIVYRKSFYTSY